MSGPTLGIIAFILAVALSSLAWAGPAVPFAVGLGVVAVVAIVFLDTRRRRSGAQSMQELREEGKAGDVEFSSRDKETLVSE